MSGGKVSFSNTRPNQHLAKIAAAINKEVDRDVSYMLSMTNLHYELHHGDAWNSSYIFNTIAADGTAFLFIDRFRHEGDVHDVGWHLYLSLQATHNIQYELFEDPDIASSGVEIPLKNRNRNFPYAEDNIVYHSPVVNNVGDVPMGEWLIPAGGFGLGGGQSAEDPGWHIFGTHTYLLRITNLAAQPAIVGVNMLLIEQESPSYSSSSSSCSSSSSSRSSSSSSSCSSSSSSSRSSSSLSSSSSSSSLSSSSKSSSSLSSSSSSSYSSSSSRSSSSKSSSSLSSSSSKSSSSLSSSSSSSKSSSSLSSSSSRSSSSKSSSSLSSSSSAAA